MRTSTVIKALLAVTAATPLLCQAESNLQTGTGSPLTATAHVDFTITIPKFLFLRVGTGNGAINAAGVFSTAPATLGTIDGITWAPTPAQLGTAPWRAPAVIRPTAWKRRSWSPTTARSR